MSVDREPVRVFHSAQYGIPCVVVRTGDSAQSIVDYCRELGAVLDRDGEEFCVALRPGVGPELWTETALRRSIMSDQSPNTVPEYVLVEHIILHELQGLDIDAAVLDVVTQEIVDALYCADLIKTGWRRDPRVTDQDGAE